MALMACVVKIERKGKIESYVVEADKFAVGRAPDCEFVIPEPQVSRQHLGVVLKGGQIFVKDLGSSNGSWMGEEKIPTDRMVPHREGQKIKLGVTEIYIHLETADRRIDEKTLANSGLDGDERSKVSQVIEQARSESKKLNEEYEKLIEHGRVQSLKESQALIEEAQFRSKEMKTQAEAQASRQISEAKAREAELISQAKMQQNTIIETAKRIANKIYRRNCFAYILGRKNFRSVAGKKFS